MKAEDLTRLMAQGEGISLEFKRCGNQPQQDVFETICSFANRQGGSILLGISDSGAVEGVPAQSVTSIERNIVNVTSNPKMFNVAPALEFEEIVIDGSTVVRIWIPMGPNVYRFKGVVYDRAADVDVRLTGDAQVHALYLRKQGYYTERKVIPWLAAGDLRPDLMTKMRGLIASTRRDHPWLGLDDEQLMISARLIARDPHSGERGLTLAAALLLGSDDVIADVLPTYRTDALLVTQHEDRYDDRLTVRANLIESYEQLLEFCERWMPDPFVLDGTQRVSARSVIVRELVANTLMHREYSSPFLSRLVIDSDGIRTRNPSRSIYSGRITLDNLDPTPKNPIIANVFNQMGRAEELGSGTRNLYKYSRLYSGYEPVLEDGDFFEALVRIPTPQATSDASNAGGAVDVDEAILVALSADASQPISSVVSATNLKERTVRRHLSALVEQGRVISDGTGRWRTYRRA